MNAGDPVVPNAQLIFALPVPRTHPLTLVASATSMLEAARPYAAIFAADGVDLDAVPAAMQAVQDAVKAKYSPARLKKGAAQGIRDQIKAGHGAIARMDEVIRPLLASDSALLTQWESVKRTAGGHNLTTPVPVPGVMIALNRAMSPAAKRLAASPPELELVRTELAPRPLDPVGSVS
jgi:hypothetical protein